MQLLCAPLTRTNSLKSTHNICEKCASKEKRNVNLLSKIVGTLYVIWAPHMHQCGKALSTLDVSPSKPPDPPPSPWRNAYNHNITTNFFRCQYIYATVCVCVCAHMCLHPKALFPRDFYPPNRNSWDESLAQVKATHTHTHTHTQNTKWKVSSEICSRPFCGFFRQADCIWQRTKVCIRNSPNLFFVCGIIKSNFSRIRQQHVVFRSAFGQYDTVDYRFVSFRSRRKEKIYPRKHNG